MKNDSMPSPKVTLLLVVILYTVSLHAQNSFLTPYQKLSKFSDGKIAQLAFSSDNKYAAAADANGKVAVWDVGSNTIVKQWTAGKPQFLKFATSGDLILVASTGEIKTFSVGDFSEKNSARFTMAPQLVSIDPTGLNLLALNKEGIEIFDMKASMMLTKIPFTMPVKNPVYMGFDRFGQQLSVITETGQVLTWNPLNQRLVRELKLQSGEYVGSRSVIHEASNNFGGDRFVVGMQEVFIPKGGFQGRNQPERRNMLVYYDWTTGQEMKRISVHWRPDEMAQGPGASDLAYYSTDTRSVMLVNYEHGEIMSSIKVNESPNRIAFSENNELFAIGNVKGEVDLYYVERNTPAEIKIESPGLDRSYASQTISQESIKVRGLVEGTERINKVMVNGAPAEYDFSGGFSADVNLEPGKNKIRVVAENAEQKQIVKDFYVTYEPKRNSTKPTGPARTGGKRVALVMGNANYLHTNKLINTLSDAKAMDATLKSLGFQVITILDGDYEKMKNAVFAFGDQINDVDISVFYYAGHGLEVDGVNYLVPVDADIQSALDVKQKSVPLPGILKTMEFTNEEGLNMIILDACRNNPFPTGKRGGSGLAKVNAPSGTLIAYATDPGSVASDGTGTNGLYTGILVEQMKIPQRIEDIFMNTRNKVEELSKGGQRPWEEARLKGVFYLK
jgi:WD40 repeat protein